MTNPWLEITETYCEDPNSDGTYLGVFTRHPLEIAKTLERPKAPLPFKTREYNPKFDDKTGKVGIREGVRIFLTHSLPSLIVK